MHSSPEITVWGGPLSAPPAKIRTFSNDKSVLGFAARDALVAAGGGSGELKVWEASTGELVYNLVWHTDQVYAVCFSSDGKFLVSGSWDRKIVVWDMETGKAIRELVGHAKWVTRVALSPNSTWLVSTGQDATIRVWSFQDGKEIAQLVGPEARVTSVAISDKYVVAGFESGEVHRWDLETWSNGI